MSNNVLLFIHGLNLSEEKPEGKHMNALKILSVQELLEHPIEHLVLFGPDGKLTLP